MKPIRLILCAAAVLALNASAITFNGTFSGEVTSLGTPVFGIDDMSDTITGTYSYEAALVNGTFSPASGNLVLAINFPDLTVLTQADDVGHPCFPTLQVAGGAVVGLDFLNIPFPLVDLLGTAWTVKLASTAVATQGTLKFSAPTSTVPDAGSSALLLGLASLGLLAVRRQQVTA